MVEWGGYSMILLDGMLFPQDIPLSHCANPSGRFPLAHVATQFVLFLLLVISNPTHLRSWGDEYMLSNLPEAEYSENYANFESGKPLWVRKPNLNVTSRV